MTGWDDPYGSSAAKEFKHGPFWHMDSRFIWNASPNHLHWQLCPLCGYRWGQDDFEYCSNPSDYPTRKHICWNCWMLEEKPEDVQKYWEKADALKSGTKPKTEEKSKFKPI